MDARTHLDAAKDIARLAKLYAQAVEQSERASDVRAALPIGSSRARVTTANARWMSAAENRDRIMNSLVKAMADAGLIVKWNR